MPPSPKSYREAIQSAGLNCRYIERLIAGADRDRNPAFQSLMECVPLKGNRRIEPISGPYVQLP